MHNVSVTSSAIMAARFTVNAINKRVLSSQTDLFTVQTIPESESGGASEPEGTASTRPLALLSHLRLLR